MIQLVIIFCKSLLRQLLLPQYNSTLGVKIIVNNNSSRGKGYITTCAHTHFLNILILIN